MARFHLPSRAEAEPSIEAYACFCWRANWWVWAKRTDSRVTDLYENLHVVNRDMSRRLGAAHEPSPHATPMALLDSYTTLLRRGSNPRCRN